MSRFRFDKNGELIKQLTRQEILAENKKAAEKKEPKKEDEKK